MIFSNGFYVHCSLYLLPLRQQWYKIKSNFNILPGLLFFPLLYSSLLISSLISPCIPFIHFCIQDPRLLMWFVSQWTLEPYQVQHRAVLDSAVHDSAVQYMTVQYSIAQYIAIWSTHTTSKLSYNYSDTG